jgi:hypothetical protein
MGITRDNTRNAWRVDVSFNGRKKYLGRFSDRITAERIVASFERNKQKLHRLAADYNLATGRTVKHFYCPILLIDESTEFCDGHIVPESIGGGKTILQRKDVDGFYGRVVESGFVSAFRLQGATVSEIMTQPHLCKAVDVNFHADGRPIRHYFEKGKIVLVDDANLKATNISLSIKADYRPESLASWLKIGHLVMFDLLRYQYVFSPAGQYMASILGDFFRRHRHKKNREVVPLLIDYFSPFINMLVTVSSDYDTLTDRIVMGFVGSTGRVFAIAPILRIQDEIRCVIMPQDETFFDFISDLPQSIGVRLYRWCEDHWETHPSPATRVSLVNLGDTLSN